MLLGPCQIRPVCSPKPRPIPATPAPDTCSTECPRGGHAPARPHHGCRVSPRALLAAPWSATSLPSRCFTCVLRKWRAKRLLLAPLHARPPGRRHYRADRAPMPLLRMSSSALEANPNALTVTLRTRQAHSPARSVACAARRWSRSASGSRCTWPGHLGPPRAEPSCPMDAHGPPGAPLPLHRHRSSLNAPARRSRFCHRRLLCGRAATGCTWPSCHRPCMQAWPLLPHAPPCYCRSAAGQR